MSFDELIGAQIEELRDALLKAFPTPAKLKELVKTRLDKDLEAITTPAPLSDRIFELIGVAESEGWTDELIRQAHDKNKGNAALNQFFAKYAGSVQRSISKGALEKITGLVGQFKNPVAWREKLAQIELQVGRVEVGGRATGTGFLVADDILLTNYHVVENEDLATMSVRFDYKVVEGSTVDAGKVYKIVGPAIDRSPYSQVDRSYPRTGTPKLAELDYAFLRLEGPAGKEMIAGKKRGFIKPLAGSPPADGILFIVQHPLGDPLQVAFDVILGLNANATRMTYKTDTQPGSSGSPAFDRDWQLVALHHGGDPRIAVRAEFNEGIPIETIRANLRPEIKALVGWT